MPTVSAKSTAQTLKIEPLRGAGWTLALSFVYAAADAGLGVAAGDPFPVDGWTWKLDVARAVTSNGKLYAVAIEDTDAAAGTLVLSGTADQLAKSQEALAGRLIGTKTGDVWVALPVEIAPLENVDLAEMPSGQVDDLGLAAVSVGGTTTPVTISVAVSGGGSGSGLDARLTAVKAALTEGVTSGLTLDPSGDLVPDDITLIDPVDYATGQVVTKQGDGSFGPSTPSGSGDMTAAVYDPTTVAGDAFDRANHTGEQAQSTVTDLVSNLAAKAPLASPALTGTPTAPTAAPGTDTTQVATAAFVQAALAALIGGATPAALDTLQELADALGDDADFAGTVTTALATKLAKASNLSDLTDAAAARTNLDVVPTASVVQTAGDQTVAGVKTFSSSPIVPAPTTDLQAATKKYVDDNAGGGGGGATVVAKRADEAVTIDGTLHDDADLALTVGAANLRGHRPVWYGGDAWL